MCGRFALDKIDAEFMRSLGLDSSPSVQANYNISPGIEIFAVRAIPDTSARQLAALRWGLIPVWAKEPSIGYKMINARSETITEKPSYRSAFKKRRCLVPVSHFYEWQKAGKTKQPFAITMADGKPFTIAGIWESWTSPGGQSVESVALLTTEPNELMKAIHDRMPVILPASVYDVWLDPKNENVESLKELLTAYPAEHMKAWPVSTMVNTPRNKGPECVESVA
jgi:putative SOS response-associated peptidase YedK